MKSILFILFIGLMVFLVTSFIMDSIRARATSAEQEEKPSLHSIIIPAIIASLVANGLISQSEATELENVTLAELEEYLLEHEVFESKDDLEQWIFAQPEIVGAGDSVFGGIDME